MQRWIRWLKVDRRVHIRTQRRTFSSSSNSSSIPIRTQGKPIHIFLNSIVKIQTTVSQSKWLNQTCMDPTRREIVRISTIKRPVNWILRVNFSSDLIKRVNQWAITTLKPTFSSKETSGDSIAITNRSVLCQNHSIISKHHHKTYCRVLITEVLRIRSIVLICCKRIWWMQIKEIREILLRMIMLLATHLS